MGQARRKPLYDPAAGYEHDFYLWSCEQAELLRQGRYSEIDLENIVEEIESLGRSDKRALISAYHVLIQHLLKWQFQPKRLSKSWRVTILVQRQQIEMLEDDSPSLAASANAHVERAYDRSRKNAAAETKILLASFPETCPYSVDQLRDAGWLPD